MCTECIILHPALLLKFIEPNLYWSKNGWGGKNLLCNTTLLSIISMFEIWTLAPLLSQITIAIMHSYYKNSSNSITPIEI